MLRFHFSILDFFESIFRHCDQPRNWPFPPLQKDKITMMTEQRKWKEIKKRGAKSFDVPSHYKSLQWLLRRKQDHCSIYVCSSSSIISPVKWSNHLRKVAAVDLYHTSPQRQRPFTILFPYLVFAVAATLNDKVKPFLPFRFSDIVKAVEM